MKSIRRIVDFQKYDDITAADILLDRSFTMSIMCGKESRMGWALKACEAVRERKRLRNPDDLLGLIAFNEHAEVIWKLTPATQLPPISDLSSLTPGGYTNISAGLRLAQASRLDQIILLTDGQHNRGEDPVPVADELKATGTQIDVIGIGDEADLDQTMLRQIATTDRDGHVHYEFIGNLQLLSGHLRRVAERRIACR